MKNIYIYIYISERQRKLDEDMLCKMGTVILSDIIVRKDICDAPDLSSRSRSSMIALGVYNSQFLISTINQYTHIHTHIHTCTHACARTHTCTHTHTHTQYSQRERYVRGTASEDSKLF